MPAGRTCRSCRSSSSLYSVQAATRYDGIAKDLLWKLKFGHEQAGTTVIAQLIRARLALPASVLVTHLPTSTSHVRQRGYDQTAYRPLLVRLGQQQQHTASKRQRLTQLANAFIVPHPTLVAGRHIVLIDDIITTGATLDAAAHVLKSAGAKRVSAVVFAQA